MEGLMTKRDIHHFLKAEITGKSCRLFIFNFVFLEPLIAYSDNTVNMSNQAKVVSDRDYYNL